MINARDIDVLADLKRDERFVPHAYRDDRGYLTIGYGRLVDERLGGGITEDEALILLDHDLEQAVTELDRALPWWREMPSAWQRGLVNMRFNMGLTRLLTFKKMLAALHAGDGERAADEALDSIWAGQVGERAPRIAALYRLT